MGIFFNTIYKKNMTLSGESIMANSTDCNCSGWQGYWMFYLLTIW